MGAGVVGNVEQIVESRRGLLGTNAQRSGQPEHGGEYRQYIDNMSGPAPDAFAKQGVKSRTYRQRQSLVVMKHRQGQTDHRINTPGMQAPVERGGGHTETGDILCFRGRDTQWRRQGMGNRFQHAVEHQADTDAGCEHHREPAGIGVVGGSVLPTDTNFAQR